MKTRLIATSIAALLSVIAVGCVQTGPPGVTAGQTDTRVEPMFCGTVATGDCATARARIREMILKNGDSEEKAFKGYVKDGLHYLGERSYDEAMKAFNAAWLVRPDDPASFHGFGVIAHRRDHDMAAAEAMFKRGLALSGAKAYLRIDYSRLLRDLNRHEDAIGQLKAAITENGNIHSLRTYIAVHYKLLGDNEMACQWIMREIDASLRPDDLNEKIRAEVCAS